MYNFIIILKLKRVGLKTVEMSVEVWKRLFGTFAHDALNAQNGNTVDYYLLALIACEDILSGKETCNSIFIQARKPDFSFVTNTSALAKIFLIHVH
jgi:hypothetical protein